MNYYHEQESAKKYIHIAEGYDGKALIQQLHSFLPDDSHVLELGMGPGTDLLLLSQQFTVTGSDYSPAFLEIFQQKHPNFELILLDAIDLETDSVFDAIYSNKVLQHLTDAELRISIQNQLKILRPKGLVCHSFWRGEGSMEMKGLFHNYHEESDLEKFFSQDFDLLSLEKYEEEEPGDSLLLIARKK